MEPAPLTTLPVLLVPGNMCDERLWEPVAKELEQTGFSIRHALWLDQPTIEAMALAVLDDIDESFVVVGFSMGAIVASELARIKPERITALGLVAFNASSELPKRAAVRPRRQAAIRVGHLETIVADKLKPNYLADWNKQDPHLVATVRHRCGRLHRAERGPPPAPRLTARTA